MSQQQYEDRPGFPVAAAVFGALSLPIRHFWTFLRAGWLPITIYGVVTFVTTYFQYTRALEILDLGPDDVQDMISLAALNGVSSLVGLVSLLILVPAITNWIRLAAVGPPPDGSFPSWEFAANEWSYLWRYIVVMVVVLLISAAAIIAVIGTSFVTVILATPILIVCFLSICWLYGRVIPYLGAAALGDAVSWRNSFDLTKSSSTRLFGAVLVFSASLYCIFLALSLIGLSVGENVFPNSPYGEGGEVNPMVMFEFFSDNPSAIYTWIAVNIVFALLLILWASVFIGRVYGYFRKVRH